MRLGITNFMQHVSFFRFGVNWSTMLRVDVFAILLLIGVMSVVWSTTEVTEAVDWCEAREKKNLPPRIAQLVDGIENELEVFRGEACYFYVRDAVAKSSPDSDVEVLIARNICAQYSSTLPTLCDMEEADFVCKFNNKFKHGEAYPKHEVLLGIEIVRLYNLFSTRAKKR